MTTQEKIERLVDALGISVSEIEKKAGLSHGGLYRAMKRNSEISVETVRKIQVAFPQVNQFSLLSGKGSILLPSPLPPVVRVMDALSRLLTYAMETGRGDISLAVAEVEYEFARNPIWENERFKPYLEPGATEQIPDDVRIEMEAFRQEAYTKQAAALEALIERYMPRTDVA